MSESVSVETAPIIAITEYPPVVVKHFHWEAAGKSYVNVWHAWKLSAARVVRRFSWRVCP